MTVLYRGRQMTARQRAAEAQLQGAQARQQMPRKRQGLPPVWRTELSATVVTSKEKRADMPGHTRSPCRYKRVYTGMAAQAMADGTLAETVRALCLGRMGAPATATIIDYKVRP